MTALLYEQILTCIIDNIDFEKRKKVVIFGTGKGGKIAASILNSFNCRYYFVDNNKEKWGTTFLGAEVCSPQKLLEEDKYSIIILIASIYSEEIAEQLIGYGFIDKTQFFTLFSNKPKVSVVNKKPQLTESILEEVLRTCNSKNPLDILIFGDSVMSIISNSDVNKETLCDMLKNELGSKYTICTINKGGFHMGIFYCTLKAMIFLNRIPSTIVLPVNIRSFSQMWDFRDDIQHSELVRDVKEYLNTEGYHLGDIYGIDEGVSYDEYLDCIGRYRGYGTEKNSKFIAWVSRKAKDEKEFFERYKYIFTWHYMYELSTENRKFKLMEEIIKLVKNNNIKLLAYATPVNYLAGQKYVGNSFTANYKLNSKMVEECFNKYTSSLIHYWDYSFLFTSEYFLHENATAEHLNEKGRSILCKIICNKLNEIKKTDCE